MNVTRSTLHFSIYLLVFACSFLLFALAAADTLIVDVNGSGDFLAIKPAVNNAADGDTIQVLPGGYFGTGNKDIDFGGKNLVLEAVDGPELTIIRGGGSGGGFHFHSGETNASKVVGFQLVNLPDGSPIRITGGSAPVIKECWILNTVVTTNNGGGIFIANSSPRIVDCVIAENRAPQDGGGIFVFGGSPIIRRCSIVGNTAYQWGGGIWMGNAATPTIDGCTIAGNLANVWEFGTDGGGLAVTDNSSPTINQTIVYGNWADQGDDLFCELGSTASFSFSDVDTSGFGGDGSIVNLVGNQYEDPHFCEPAYCEAEPWTTGDYSLAENSPCLPENNPHHVLIGSHVMGCDTVVVWTGDGLSTTWETASNWSTGEIPRQGDHVQINKGQVELSSTASIGKITVGMEASIADTFFVRPGGHLILGDWPETFRKAKRDTSRSTHCGTVIIEEKASCNEDHTILVPGNLIVEDGELFGPLTIDILGKATVAGDSDSHVNMNSRVGGGRIPSSSGSKAKGSMPGIYFEAGKINFTGTLTNETQVTVAGDATVNLSGSIENYDGSTLNLNGTLTNAGSLTVAGGATLVCDGQLDIEPAGTVTLTGDINGAGIIDNLGQFDRSGIGSSSLLPEMNNIFDSETGTGGRISVSEGFLTALDLSCFSSMVVASGAVLTVDDSLTLHVTGVLAGTGSVNIAEADFYQMGPISPGTSSGILTLIGDYAPLPTGSLHVEIGGTEAGTEHDQLNVIGSANLDGALHVSFINDFMPSVPDAFLVIAATGPITSHFNCLSGMRISDALYLQPMVTQDGLLLVTQVGSTGNPPPVAVPDTVTVSWQAPAVISPLDNDEDSDALSLVELDTSATLGTAFIDPGGTTLTYIPPVNYVTGDTLVYMTTDCHGGNDSATILILLNDVSDGLPGSDLPSMVALPSSFPNPFNPMTRIRFDLPQAGNIELAVYDLKGRKVKTLLSGYHAAGRFVHDWWGVDDQGRRLGSGVYFARLRAEGKVAVRKMLMIK